LGGVHPRGGPDGASELRAECLIAGVDPRIDVTVRFAQAIERQLLDPAEEPVEELIVTGRRYSSSEEMVEREVSLATLPYRTASIRTAGSERAELTEGGARAGVLLWRWEPLHATVEAWTDEIRPGLRRVRVAVANRLEWDRLAPEQNQMRTLHSTRVLIESNGGDLASLADPPPRRRRLTARARYAA
jgi:hypothetical protein